MRRWLCALLWLVAAVFLRAQSTEWVSVPFDQAHWTLEGDDAAPTKFLGRDALRLHRATATLKDVDFSTGSVEFDASFQHEQEFIGLFFRAHEADADYFYLRPHQSGRPDSNQYIPLLDHDSCCFLSGCFLQPEERRHTARPMAIRFFTIPRLSVRYG